MIRIFHFLLIAVLLVSCKKEKKFVSEDPGGSASVDNDTRTVSDLALCLGHFDDCVRLSNEASVGAGSLLSPCATVTHDTLANKIVIDFGTLNCLCTDGRYRRGKLFIEYINYTIAEPYSYWDSLTFVTIKTADSSGTNKYYVNDNELIGTIKVLNRGLNSFQISSWDITISNAQVVKAGSQGTISYSANLQCTRQGGQGTQTVMDDIFGVTGSCSGTGSDGGSFTASIPYNLIKRMDCIRWFVSGTCDLTQAGKPHTRYINYAVPGNGSCDNLINVLIGNNTYDLTLP